MKLSQPQKGTKAQKRFLCFWCFFVADLAAHFDAIAGLKFWIFDRA